MSFELNIFGKSTYFIGNIGNFTWSHKRGYLLLQCAIINDVNFHHLVKGYVD